MPRANREATTASAGAATKRPSPKKPHSTASASFAPNVPEDDLPAEETVRSCKSLSRVGRAFRSCRSVDLLVRPVYHRLDPGCGRTSSCACSPATSSGTCDALSRRCSSTITTPEDRSSPVEPARRSRAAIAKANSRRTADGFPVHSFQTLLADLAALTRNQRYACTAPAAPPSISSPDPRHCRAKPSDCCECVPDRRKVPSSVQP